MNSSIAMPVANGAPLTRDRMERMFYLLSGCLLLVIVTLGFQQFYLHGKANNGGSVTQQIMPLVFLHGILMSSWVVLFVAQSSLIVRGNRKLHMSLGVAGAVLAACLVVVGLATAIASVHYNPEGYKEIWGARRFLSLMLTNMLGFGVLAGVGLKYRRRPEVHRPMMLLATLFVAGPAGSFRIPWIIGPIMANIHTIFAVWVPMLILGILLVLLKWFMTRSLDRYVAVGFIGIVLACLVQFFVSSTAWWYQIAGWVTA
ncbi:MAG TPA: hypothetical protein VFN26_03670 [Candidatus Acidoferrum sp.]|nr:hypothetical protein [Candidatus Acidoferrum sp.]